GAAAVVARRTRRLGEGKPALGRIAIGPGNRGLTLLPRGWVEAVGSVQLRGQLGMGFYEPFGPRLGVSERLPGAVLEQSEEGIAGGGGCFVFGQTAQRGNGCDDVGLILRRL